MSEFIVGFGNQGILSRVTVPEGATPQELIKEALYSAACASMNPGIFQGLPVGAVKFTILIDNVEDFVLCTETGAIVQRLEQTHYVLYHKNQVEIPEEDAPVAAEEKEEAPVAEEKKEAAKRGREEEEEIPEEISCFDPSLWDEAYVLARDGRWIAAPFAGRRNQGAIRFGDALREVGVSANVQTEWVWKNAAALVVKLPAGRNCGDWVDAFSPLRNTGIEQWVTPCYTLRGNKDVFAVLLRDEDDAIRGELEVAEDRFACAMHHLKAQHPEIFGGEEAPLKRPREEECVPREEIVPEEAPATNYDETPAHPPVDGQLEEAPSVEKKGYDPLLAWPEGEIAAVGAAHPLGPCD